MLDCTYDLLGVINDRVFFSMERFDPNKCYQSEVRSLVVVVVAVVRINTGIEKRTAARSQGGDCSRVHCQFCWKNCWNREI